MEKTSWKCTICQTSKGGEKKTDWKFSSGVIGRHFLKCAPTAKTIHNKNLIHISLTKYIYSYIYWSVHHLDSWVKRDQLDVTCFIISLFNAQHVSDVNTSIHKSLWLVCWVISWVVLLWFDVCWCYAVVWLLRMDVLTSKTCWALNKKIIKQVTSSWSLFTQINSLCYHQLRKFHFINCVRNKQSEFQPSLR